jgi:OmpA-OmpF porin, OOP family
MARLAIVLFMLLASRDAQQPAALFPAPANHPEQIGSGETFPFIPPITGTRLIQTSRIDGPLEVRSATAEDEAVLAGMAFVKKRYAKSVSTPDSAAFVAHYRDALFAAGWKLIDVTKPDPAGAPPAIVTVAAHYMNDGRNIYARIAKDPEGPYEIAVADVGAEDWAAMLANECRLVIHSLHFDLDRPTLRVFESMPTLEKLAALLSAKSAPAVEVEGHMDNIGEAGAAARQTLSEARAKAVAAWLTAHGVPAARISAKGYGKMRPIAENDSDLCRALNRRIEVACLRH